MNGCEVFGGKLKPLVGNTSSFIKDSTHLVNMMKDWKMKEDYILISFDVVSLYKKIPINEAIEVIRGVLNEDIPNLVEICLKSTFFIFCGEIYEQIEGVSMGSPLSPIVANLFMESFKKKAIESFPFKPK
jgi:hypothetical protein